MVSMGREGYVEATRKIVATARAFEKAVQVAVCQACLKLSGDPTRMPLQEMDGVYQIGSCDTTVVAWSSDDFDIYRLTGAVVSAAKQSTF